MWPDNQAKRGGLKKIWFGSIPLLGHSFWGVIQIENVAEKKLPTDLFECAKRALCSVKSEMRCPQNLLAKLALLLKPEERLLQHVAGKRLGGVHRWCTDASFRR